MIRKNAAMRRRMPAPGAVFLALLLLLCLGGTLFAQAPQNPAEQDAPAEISWELFHVQDPAADEPPVVLVVWIEPEEGYHAYGHDPGSSGQPTNLSVTPPPGVEARIYYPKGEHKPDVFDPSVEVEIFSGRTPLFVALSGELSEPLLVVGEVGMLLCSETSCWPVRQELIAEGLDLAPGALSIAQEQPWWPRFKELLQGQQAAMEEERPEIEIKVQAPAVEKEPGAIEELEMEPRYFQPALEVHSLGKAALFAILAGFILNFMPCVLPVVSLKLSTLVAATGVGEAGAKTRTFREHNVFFALGILIYFVILGVILGAAGLAWGQIFQKPGLVLGVTAVVFGLGLSLFGVFDLPIVDLKTGTKAKSHRSQALFTGLLATLLATPCSGPFLGGVLGWTLTQAPSTIVAVFVCIGLGMALPYVLMAFKPGLVRLFPKPGGWTIYLERLVGFFLMGTCVYLLNILPPSYMLSALVLLLLTAFAAWMWGSWTGLSDSTGRRLTIRGLALALVAGAAFWAFQPPDPGVDWASFKAEAFQQAFGKRNMLIDFTADWCPNCKVLEKTTLAPDNLDDWQEKYDLLLLQADLTEEHPEAQALLQKLGSQSIPVVALFPEGEQSGRPLVLRDIFTAAQLETALEQAFGPRGQ